MGIWQHILHITISLFILNDVCWSQYLRNGYYENHAPLNELLTEIIELNTRLTDPYWQKSSAMETMYKEAEDDDEWVVEIDGGLEEAQWVASLTGCKLLGKMKGFDHMYVMRHSKEASPGTVRSLLKRSKRDTNEKVPKETKSLSELVKELKQVKFVEHQQYLARRKRFAINKQFSNLNRESTFNDPYFAEQWQLHESVILNYPYDISPLRVDHHISDVWQMGYTGKGVVVTIIDDGIDYTHDDLRPNYDPLASYDLNDDDDDPMPTLDEINSHGTRCAGEVAMAANNSRCGVGVAYNAKIGGIRLLDGKLNDRMEAEAFTFALGHVDIMSISWGPKDDGKTIEKPGRLSQMALEKGIKEGRNGLGTIYVWASGNGGMVGDSCAADGYASSPYSFTVSAIASDGTVPWYAEDCASTLVSTYSTGYLDNKLVLTTNPGNTCTYNHTGTSAATPIAVGIIALALETNPKLTWRDIQHLAVWTADPTPSLLQRNKEWQMNRAGFLYHPKLGFGLMNALKFVQTAESWKTVPQQQICVTEYGNYQIKSFHNSTDGVIKFETDGCNNDPNHVTFIERVQLITSIKADFRGHVSLWLESPEGTKSQILPSRPVDLTDEGFLEWPLNTVHMWGENPKGVWTLYIKNANQWEALSSSIHIESIKLVLYGTREAPQHYSEPREYGLALGYLEKEQNLDKVPMEKFDRKYNFEEMLERLNSANSKIRNTLGM